MPSIAPPARARPRITLGAEDKLASETLLAEAGAYALTLSTNLRELGALFRDHMSD